MHAISILQPDTYKRKREASLLSFNKVQATTLILCLLFLLLLYEKGVFVGPPLEYLKGNKDTMKDLDLGNFTYAMKDGWIAGYRKVIGLDGCFLKGTIKGEFLTTMGRDANNQIFSIAWAVVNVKNKDNWLWFLVSLGVDLNLKRGANVTIIPDGHKTGC
nr:hypothetical protein CTI12_AA159120 [Tanacetum cinerariifolium]